MCVYDFFCVSSVQYPALKPKKKLRLQPYVPRVFGYKIRERNHPGGDVDKTDDGDAAAAAGAKVQETAALIAENAKLKAQLLKLEQSLATSKASQ